MLFNTDNFVKYNMHHQQHRSLEDVISIINSGDLLPLPVKEKSIKAFTLLAEAEAYIHSTTVDKVHFHEVGAIDSIIDTVGY